MKYYIPQKESELVSWSGNLIDVTKKYKTALGIADEQITELEGARGAYVTLYEKCQTPGHSALDIGQKNDLMKALVGKLQKFVRFHLQNNEAMTDDMRREIGIPVHDTTPTHHPPPDSRPVITTSSNNPFEIILHIHDSATGKRGKPDHVAGAVVFWGVSDTPVTDAGGLPNSMLVTRTPHIMNFPPADRGKLVYFAACWQTGTGEKTPSGEVVSAVIP
jgi:hypothetical protein